MRARPLPGLLRLLEGRVAGPRVADVVAVARELVGSGRQVGLAHLPPDGAAVPALLAALPAGRVAAACEITVPAGDDELAAAVRSAGASVAVDGSNGVADPDPGTRVIVRAAEPGAEERCRSLADGRVRLTRGRGPGAALALVRCLNVLMAGAGDAAVAATDPRLVAIAGERAAWYDRPPESWEYAMPYGVRTDEQRRLTAAGHRVRVLVPWGPGAAASLVRGPGGRS